MEDDEDVSGCGVDKFPRTKHLCKANPDSQIGSDDILMSEAEQQEFLGHALVVEEKVDGLNFGISFGADGKFVHHHRGGHGSYAKEWAGLETWLEDRRKPLFNLLNTDCVLFGEWVANARGIRYTKLPSKFIAFDIFLIKHSRFVSIALRDQMLSEAFGGCRPDQRIPLVPRVAAARVYSSIEELLTLLRGRHSQFCDSELEGIYLRYDSDDGEWLGDRAKIVNAWYKAMAFNPTEVPNIIDEWAGYDGEYLPVGSGAGPAVEGEPPEDDLDRTPGGGIYKSFELGAPLRLDIAGNAIVVDVTEGFPDHQGQLHVTVLWRKRGFSKDDLYRVQAWFNERVGEEPVNVSVKKPEDGTQKIYLVARRLRDLCQEARASFSDWIDGELADPHVSIPKRQPVS